MVLLADHGERAGRRRVSARSWSSTSTGCPSGWRPASAATRLPMVHGSPWPPFGDYLGPWSPALRRADELDVEILVLGHTHVPMVERFGHTLVVNPGSVSEPRQADRVRTCAVIDTDALSARVVAVP